MLKPISKTERAEKTRVQIERVDVKAPLEGLIRQPGVVVRRSR